MQSMSKEARTITEDPSQIATELRKALERAGVQGVIALENFGDSDTGLSIVDFSGWRESEGNPHALRRHGAIAYHTDKNGHLVEFSIIQTNPHGMPEPTILKSKNPEELIPTAVGLIEV